jgi:hypothetical protein
MVANEHPLSTNTAPPKASKKSQLLENLNSVHSDFLLAQTQVAKKNSTLFV